MHCSVMMGTCSLVSDYRPLSFVWQPGAPSPCHLAIICCYLLFHESAVMSPRDSRLPSVIWQFRSLSNYSTIILSRYPTIQCSERRHLLGDLSSCLQGCRHGFLSGGRNVGDLPNRRQEKTPDFGLFILESGGTSLLNFSLRETRPLRPPLRFRRPCLSAVVTLPAKRWIRQFPPLRISLNLTYFQWRRRRDTAGTQPGLSRDTARSPPGHIRDALI